MKTITFLLYIVAGLVTCLVGGFGCIEKDGQEADEKEWTPPDQLKVTEVAAAVVAEDLLVLLDTSCSGTSTQRQEAAAEARAVLEQAPLSQAACLVPITSDSQATQPWCWKPIELFGCTHQVVKSDGFISNRERDEYAAAAKRVEQELADCQAKAKQVVEQQTAARNQGLASYLAGLQPSGKTDLTGAFLRAEEVRTRSQPAVLWLFSDMVEDALVQRTSVVDIDLSGVTVNVRQVLQPGGGYDNTLKQVCLAQLQQWKAAQVNWANFRVGEFSAGVPTTGGGASGSNGAVPPASPPPPPAPPPPPPASTPTRAPRPRPPADLGSQVKPRGGHHLVIGLQPAEAPPQAQPTTDSAAHELVINLH